MQCIVGKVCKPQHTTSVLWALAYAIFSTWYAIHSFHHQSHELIFILQNPANHCQFPEDFQTPDIWVSSSWLLASILQISVVLYFKNSLFIYFFTFHLSSPFCVLLQGQTASPSSFWQLIRCPEPSKYSKKCWKNNQGKKICQESSTGPPRGANRSGWGAPSTECWKVPM